jgi:DNA-binding transcriptional ArsR family regulator
MNDVLEIKAMHDASEQLIMVLKSFANHDRLLILCHLSQQELNVSQIEQVTQIHQPTLSQQLMILRKSHAVVTRRVGKQIFYSVQDPKILKVLNTLYHLYCPTT